MCIAVWTLNHQDYALVLAENRDELLSRPTMEAQWHSFDQHDGPPSNVLSGRDVQAGGTWCGISRAGKVAVLTNITEPIKPCASSRGSLTANFLLSDSSSPMEEQARQLVAPDAKFAGFNLLLFSHTSDPDGTLRYESIYVTNRGSGGEITYRPLSPQERRCGCVSNAVDGLNAEWVKVRHASNDLETLLEQKELPESEIVEQLFHLLSYAVANIFPARLSTLHRFSPIARYSSWRSTEEVTERSKLRNTVHVSPFNIKLEGYTSTGNHSYGTRLSTILLIRKDGQALFIERDIWRLENGEVVKQVPGSQRVFRFQIDPKSH